MKAKELISILNLAPEAEVKFENFSNSNVFMATTYNLEQVNGYRVIRDYKGNIECIILSSFEIQPY